MGILTRKKIFSKTAPPGPIGPTGSVGGTGIAGQVTYWAGTTTLAGDNNFTWDPVNFVFSIQDTLGTNLITADANTGYFNISTSGYTFYYDGSSGTLNLGGPLIWNGNTYFPPTLPVAGVLTNDGAGNLSWLAPTTGTVTSVSALTLGTTGTDLSSSVATGTTTPVITLNVPTASATNRGALSSTDWSTFNAKQGAITLSTTGTSGAATLIGNTLNIPQYSGGSTTVPLANSVFVSKSGNDGTGTRGHLELPFLTINAAASAASAGDTIVVYPGAYALSTSLPLAGSLNYVFEGKGTLTISTNVPFFAEAAGVTNNIYAPEWTITGTNVAQEVILLTDVATTSVCNLTIKDITATGPVLHIRKNASAIINCYADSIISSDSVAVIWNELAGGVGGGTINCTANLVKGTTSGVVTLYAERGSGNYHIKNLINSGATGGAFFWEQNASSSADRVYIEADLIQGNDGWTAWYAGDGKCYVQAKRIQGSGTCTVVCGGNSEMHVTGASVHNTRGSGRHGLMHAENSGNLYANSCTLTKDVIGTPGTDYDLQVTDAGHVWLNGVSYNPIAVSMVQLGDITKWNGTNWVNIPYIINNTGTGCSIDNSDLENITINFAGFNSCLIQDIVAKDVPRITFSADSQVYAPSMNKVTITAFSGSYIPGFTYEINNAANTYCPTSKVYVTAITTDKLDLANCSRTMNVPFTYIVGGNDGHGGNWVGIYNPSAISYGGNDLVVWGGRVWINLTASVGTAIDDITLDPTNWSLRDQPTFPYDYIEMEFGCSYDLVNDWVNKQWDDKGNKFGWDSSYQNCCSSYSFNPCDVSDWNYETSGFAFFNNITLGIWNLTNVNLIYNNSVNFILNNIVGTGGDITGLVGNYFEYKVLLTQSGASVPAETILFDNLSVSVGGISYLYNNSGDYSIKRNDLNNWDITKTEMIIGSANDGTGAGVQGYFSNISMMTSGSNKAQLSTSSHLVVGTDGLLNNTPLTIRIYF